MILTLENLKADEQAIVNRINTDTGALAYNRQLQVYLQRCSDAPAEAAPAEAAPAEAAPAEAAPAEAAPAEQPTP